MVGRLVYYTVVVTALPDAPGGGGMIVRRDQQQWQRLVLNRALSTSHRRRHASWIGVFFRGRYYGFPYKVRWMYLRQDNTSTSIKTWYHDLNKTTYTYYYHLLLSLLVSHSWMNEWIIQQPTTNDDDCTAQYWVVLCLSVEINLITLITMSSEQHSHLFSIAFSSYNRIRTRTSPVSVPPSIGGGEFNANVTGGGCIKPWKVSLTTWQVGGCVKHNETIPWFCILDVEDVSTAVTIVDAGLNVLFGWKTVYSTS